MAIDYGTKRTGLAVTDMQQIIASALTTVSTSDALAYIKEYASKEPLDSIVIGIPKHLDNTAAELVPEIERFIVKLESTLPHIPVHKADERFTSKMAFQSMIESGQSRKTRRDKSNIDKISAAIILQSWLEQKKP